MAQLDFNLNHLRAVLQAAAAHRGGDELGAERQETEELRRRVAAAGEATAAARAAEQQAHRRAQQLEAQAEFLARRLATELQCRQELEGRVAARAQAAGPLPPEESSDGGSSGLHGDASSATAAGTGDVAGEARLEQENADLRRRLMAATAQLVRFGASLERAVQLGGEEEQEWESSMLGPGGETSDSPASSSGGGSSYLAPVGEASRGSDRSPSLPISSSGTSSATDGSPATESRPLPDCAVASLERQLAELKEAKEAESAAAREAVQALMERCSRLAQEGEQALAAQRADAAAELQAACRAAHAREQQLQAELEAAIADAEAAQQVGAAQLETAQQAAAAELAAAQQGWQEREEALVARRHELEAAAKKTVQFLEGRVAHLEALATGRQPGSSGGAQLAAQLQQRRAQQAVGQLQQQLQAQREHWEVVRCNYVRRVARWRLAWLLRSCFLAWRCRALLARSQKMTAAAGASGTVNLSLADEEAAAGGAATGQWVALAAAATVPQALPPRCGPASGASGTINFRSPLTLEEDAPRALLAVLPSPARPLPAPGAHGTRPTGGAAAASRAGSQRPARCNLLSSRGAEGSRGAVGNAGSGDGSSRWTTASTEMADGGCATGPGTSDVCTAPAAVLAPAGPAQKAPAIAAQKPRRTRGQQLPSAHQITQLKASLMEALGANDSTACPAAPAASKPAAAPPASNGTARPTAPAAAPPASARRARSSIAVAPTPAAAPLASAQQARSSSDVAPAPALPKHASSASPAAASRDPPSEAPALTAERPPAGAPVRRAPPTHSKQQMLTGSNSPAPWRPSSRHVSILSAFHVAQGATATPRRRPSTEASDVPALAERPAGGSCPGSAAEEAVPTVPVSGKEGESFPVIEGAAAPQAAAESPGGAAAEASEEPCRDAPAEAEAGEDLPGGTAAAAVAELPGDVEGAEAAAGAACGSACVQAALQGRELEQRPVLEQQPAQPPAHGGVSIRRVASPLLVLRSLPTSAVSC